MIGHAGKIKISERKIQDKEEKSVAGRDYAKTGEKRSCRTRGVT